MPRRKKGYSGALAQPIDLRKLGLVLDEDAVRKEIVRKTALLVEHFGIDPTLPPERFWQALAVRLAFDHVPGLNIVVSGRRGAKRKWTLEECRKLVRAVDAQGLRKGIKHAVRMARKKDNWKWGAHVPSIEARYFEAVRRIKQDEFIKSHPDGVLGALMSGDLFDHPSKRTTRGPRSKIS